MLGSFNRELTRDLTKINVGPEIREEIDRERMKLAAIEIPKNVDAETNVAIRRSINESFIGGFRLVMWIAAGLAVASSATAWFLIQD